ncbi:Phthiocerol synthesis polyketide synthase type I PpsC [Folsomia candida]|uniref:Phthiocerol synthesis polyketide synthase type I PpsC n=1 Tax=Folsomia candida TaxID=158441 RepID=A0A226DL45_FOLCA|nr:Phthiocerol synthesis polyketide synthase type I PpsC [Folsomia candida]
MTLANLFDGMIQLTSFAEIKVDFWTQLLLTCSTILDFDRICLIDPSSLSLNLNAHFINRKIYWSTRAVYMKQKFVADLTTGDTKLEPSTKIAFLGESINPTTDRMKDLFDFRNKIKQMAYAKPQCETEPITVIGMSCRMPDSCGVDEYWKTYLDGKSVIRPHPDGRWTTEQIGAMGNIRIECGFVPCSVDEFDGDFFEMSPVECNFTDPQQRSSTEVSWEALEDAGINPQSLAGSMTAIYSGCWTQDYNDLIQKFAPPSTGELRWYMGNSYAAGAARLAHIYKVRGPNLGVDVACSSSFVAVGQAVHDLRRGAANLAIATTANLIIKPTYQNDVVLSKDSRCKTFDASANGFARSEGVAALILKRLSDAVRDGDRIHSIIMGYGATQEGETKSVGTPTVEMEALAMELSLRDAGMKPEQIQVVEAHGTGTAKGDPLEIKAISKAYSASGRTDPLIITAGKANIGHT